MKSIDRHMPRPGLAILMAWVLLVTISPALAQIPQADEERLQILTDPEAIKKKVEKDKNRPPFEFFRSSVAPFDGSRARSCHYLASWRDRRAETNACGARLQTDQACWPLFCLGT